VTAAAPASRLSGLRGKALKLAVSALAVWLIARQLDAKALAGVLKEARFAPVGGAFVLYLVGQAITAWRWQVIARAAGFRAPLARVLVWYFIGMFFNLFGPSTLGGDFVRTLYLAAGTGRTAAATQTVVFDRFVGLATLVLLGLAAIAAFGAFGLPEPVVWVAASIGILLAGGWWAAPVVMRRVLPALGKLPAQFEDDLKIWRDRRLLFATASISLGFHVLQTCAAILVGEAAGLGVPYPFYFVFHPLVTVFSAVPVSLAGIGVREAGYIWFLTAYGATSNEHATAFALLWLAVLTGSSIVGGLVFLLSGAEVPKDPRR